MKTKFLLLKHLVLTSSTGRRVDKRHFSYHAPFISLYIYIYIYIYNKDLIQFRKSWLAFVFLQHLKLLMVITYNMTFRNSLIQLGPSLNFPSVKLASLKPKFACITNEFAENKISINYKRICFNQLHLTHYIKNWPQPAC